jgi:hypothetical protein
MVTAIASRHPERELIAINIQFIRLDCVDKFRRIQRSGPFVRYRPTQFAIAKGEVRKAPIALPSSGPRADAPILSARPFPRSSDAFSRQS